MNFNPLQLNRNKKLCISDYTVPPSNPPHNPKKLLIVQMNMRRRRRGLVNIPRRSLSSNIMNWLSYRNASFFFCNYCMVSSCDQKSWPQHIWRHIVKFKKILVTCGELLLVYNRICSKHVTEVHQHQTFSSFLYRP